MDEYYVLIWLFSVAFFAGVMYLGMKNFYNYIEKEKELNKLDGRFDNFKKHRESLIVSEASPSITTTGRSSRERGAPQRS